jgi:hypothetical protein
LEIGNRALEECSDWVALVATSSKFSEGKGIAQAENKEASRLWGRHKFRRFEGRETRNVDLEC